MSVEKYHGGGELTAETLLARLPHAHPVNREYLTATEFWGVCAIDLQWMEDMPILEWDVLYKAVR